MRVGATTMTKRSLTAKRSWSAPDPIIMRAVVAKGHIGVYNRARITVVFCVSSKDEKTKLSRGVRDGLEDTIA